MNRPALPFPWSAALLLAAGTAVAGPPFVTDDPEPVGFQRHLAYQVTFDNGMFRFPGFHH